MTEEVEEEVMEVLGAVEEEGAEEVVVVEAEEVSCSCAFVDVFELTCGAMV